MREPPDSVTLSTGFGHVSVYIPRDVSVACHLPRKAAAENPPSAYTVNGTPFDQRQVPTSPVLPAMRVPEAG